MTQTQHKAKAYNVYLRGKLIDTVWFTGYTAEEARKSLIDHDCYNPAIVVNARKVQS